MPTPRVKRFGTPDRRHLGFDRLHDGGLRVRGFNSTHARPRARIEFPRTAWTIAEFENDKLRGHSWREYWYEVEVLVPIEEEPDPEPKDAKPTHREAGFRLLDQGIAPGRETGLSWMKWGDMLLELCGEDPKVRGRLSRSRLKAIEWQWHAARRAG
jgi:hypothetical protein